MIGHTQPRRIAARTLAARIAEECGVDLGAEVGFAVRFTDRTAKGTKVKVMTDGILLAELQRDRDLRRYDTIIIDEAHERSLNIDFLLGYLTRLLPRRPDLRVIVTSATIDVERFSTHFGGAPIIEVSGRTYPVEIRYRPTEDVASDDVDAVCEAVMECLTSGDGDVLVFLSGQREIHDVADALRPMLDVTTTVLPLYARLSAAEQHRVFAPGVGAAWSWPPTSPRRRSPCPGIRYVVDPGTARISRYSKRLKVQRLPIEPISQASANQRAGRCGRVRDGIAIRLYAEQDFLDRPEFTDPEILRTNLASVILQMAALRLGEIERFPFLDPPDTRQIRDGVALLQELGALKEGSGPPRLTPLGRQLARLPLDPRLGRMVLAAAEAGLRAGGGGHRRRADHPGPPRAPGGRARQGRRRARPLRRQALGLLHPAQPVGPHPQPAQQHVVQRPAPGLPRPVPELPAHPRVAGPRRPDPRGALQPGDQLEQRPRTTTTACTGPC